MASMNDLVVSIGADIANLRKDMGKMERTVSQSSGRMGKIFGAAFKLSNLTNAARGIKAIFDTLYRSISGPIMLFAQFDETMRFVKARSGATAEQLKALTEQASDLGRATSFTRGEVAEGMKALATVGVGADEIQKITPGMLSLAKATGTDLPLAAQTASVLLKQFNLKGRDTGHVMDVMTFAANNSQLTVEKLAESFRIFAPSAKKFQTSIEDATAAAMVLSNKGVAASTIGTGLRRILATTATEAEELKKVFGVSFIDPKTKEFVGLAEAMRRMDTQMNKMGKNQTERANMMREAFELLGMNTGIILTDASDKLKDFTDQMKGTEIDGLAERSRKFIEGGMMGAIKRVESAWDDFKMNIVAGLEEPLLDIFKQVTSWIKYLSSFVGDFTEPIKDFINWVGDKIRILQESSTWSEGFKNLAASFADEIIMVREGLMILVKDLGEAFANAMMGVMTGPRPEKAMAHVLKASGVTSGASTLIEMTSDVVRGPEEGKTWDDYVNDMKKRKKDLEDAAEGRRRQREAFIKRQEEEQRIKAAAKLAQQANREAARKAAFGTMADPTAKKKEVAPSEVHGFGGGAGEQLGSAAAYRKIFDYFTSQKKNKADQERNKILKQIEANTKAFGGDDLIAGFEGEI
jgi:TP901 family phage tail tape measure protein